MNNLLHLFEEDQIIEYVRAPFPKDDDSWKDNFDIKRYNKKVWIYHNTKGEALYGVCRYDNWINPSTGKKDKLIFQFSYCSNKKNFVKANLWKQEAHLYDEHLMAESKFDTCGIVEGEKKMNSAKKSVLPEINRAIIFRTDAESNHGFPDPIRCPENVTRKSIALYYYTKEKTVLPLTIRRRKYFHAVWKKRPNVDEPKFGDNDSFFKRLKHKFFYRFF